MCEASALVNRRLLGIALAISLGLSGCSTHFDRVIPIREQFYTGHLHAARTQIEQTAAKRKYRKERDVLLLDRAMIELADGNPREAERLLRQVRTEFDKLEGRDLRETVLGLATDDQTHAYSGEDYERVLIRAMLAISNVMHDGGDAKAYALQTTEKQQEIIDKLAERDEELPEAVQAYKQLAIGPYVRAMLDEESPLTLTDAARSRLQVVNWEPDFAPGQQDLQRAEHHVAMSPGMGAVYIFALVGRGPIKEEVAEPATQVSLFIADQIVSALSRYSVPPTIAPVKVPKVVRCYSPIENIEIAVRGQYPVRTATLVNVTEMALRQQEARYPEIIARAVARRVLKKGAMYALKDGLNASPGASVALDLAGIAWEATENADTRCWGLLPDRIQVARLELPAGVHHVRFSPYSRERALSAGVTAPVTIHEGRHSYMLATFPNTQLVGQIVVNDASEVDAPSAPER